LSIYGEDGMIQRRFLLSSIVYSVRMNICVYCIYLQTSSTAERCGGTSNQAPATNREGADGNATASAVNRA